MKTSSMNITNKNHSEIGVMWPPTSRFLGGTLYKPIQSTRFSDKPTLRPIGTDSIFSLCQVCRLGGRGNCGPHRHSGGSPQLQIASLLGQSYMDTLILTSLFVLMRISTFTSKEFVAGYQRLAMINPLNII